MRLVISAEFWELAVSEAAKQPLIFGPEDYLTSLLNGELLRMEDRVNEALNEQELRDGNCVPPPEFDPDDDCPF